MTYDLSDPGGFYWGSIPPQLPDVIKTCKPRSEPNVIQRIAELTAKPRVKVKTG